MSVIIITFYYRKISSRSDKFAVSANMAYGQVNMVGTIQRVYENAGQCTDSTMTAAATRSHETTAATYETIDTHSNLRAPSSDHVYEYARPDSERLCIKPAVNNN